jgi:outer membrane protein
MTGHDIEPEGFERILNNHPGFIWGWYRKAQDDFEKKQRDLLTPIFEKAQAAIKEVAQANKFTYIFDSSRSKGVLVYTEGGENVMPLVKAKLGIQ